MKLKKAITDRLASAHQNVKNETCTVGYMLREFNARVYKPQRLLSISFEEEEKRALAGWRSFDNALRVATLDSIEDLGEHVLSPQAFRENVKDCVIFMSDQAPRGNSRRSACFQCMGSGSSSSLFTS